MLANTFCISTARPSEQRLLYTNMNADHACLHILVNLSGVCVRDGWNINQVFEKTITRQLKNTLKIYNGYNAAKSYAVLLEKGITNYTWRRYIW